ncbi:hypothetical protein DPMN_020601 [Dreissena polymorpha]|uniref:Secreted protein n=1 Tax=Dreissena polymorpha TaxID=45954 RepID=A0A9D4NMF8_DREPO|nr:hypothetical protein DPMN_020601 [Dreissena polymorpha]
MAVLLIVSELLVLTGVKMVTTAATGCVADCLSALSFDWGQDGNNCCNWLCCLTMRNVENIYLKQYLSLSS